MCNMLGELTAAYRAVGELEKAIDLARQRCTVCRSIDRQGQVNHALHQLATFFLEQEQLDSAYYYFQELYEAKKGPSYDFHAVIGLLETTLAMESFDRADKHAREALSYLENGLLLSEEDRYGLYIVLSRYHLAKKEHAQAYEYTRKYFNLIQELKGDTTERAAYAWGGLTKVQAAIGDYEAPWHSYDTFHQLRMAWCAEIRKMHWQQQLWKWI